MLFEYKKKNKYFVFVSFFEASLDLMWVTVLGPFGLARPETFAERHFKYVVGKGIYMSVTTFALF